MQVTMLNIKFIENTLKVSYRSRHHEEQNGTDGISLSCCIMKTWQIQPKDHKGGILMTESWLAEDTHQWHAFFHKTFYKTGGLQSLL